MNLRDARPVEIDQVLAHTHALWSDGLALPAYREYIATLMGSEWARQDGGRYRFLVLLEDGEILSGLKLYRFSARLDGEAISAGGVGAVFTPLSHRGRGHAAAMLSMAHQMMAERGDSLSLLFSEIGATYYERHGYSRLPAHHVRIRIPDEARPAPGVRRMKKPDLDLLIRIREREDAGASFALVRDRPYWSFLLARVSMPTLWLGADAWESRIMVAEGAGYLWGLFGGAHDGAAARILEFGESAPGTALPALLDDFFAECRRRGVAEVEAWLPAALEARDPRLAALLTRVDPPPVVPMWRPLDDEAGRDMELHRTAVAFLLTDLY